MSDEIEQKALERALTTLAERAVIAEARAKIAEAELVVLKQQLADEKSASDSWKWNHAQFSAMHWAKAGVMRNRLVDHFKSFFGDRKEAEDLVDGLTGSVFMSPDSSTAPDLRWP